MPPYWPPALPRSLPPVEATPAHNLRTTVARFGARPGIGFVGRELTWRACNEQVKAFAGWLRGAAGLRRGERVAIFAQNPPQWLVAYHGTQRADGVAVPVTPMARAGKLGHVLADSGARVLVAAQHGETPAGRSRFRPRRPRQRAAHDQRRRHRDGGDRAARALVVDPVSLQLFRPPPPTGARG